MNTTGEAQRVEVEIVLQGGLRHVSVVPSTSPILHDLYVALAQGNNPQQPPFVVQFPLDGGRVACSFLSSSLISLQTKPPVLIQVQNSQVAGAALAAIAPVEKDHVLIADFLTPGENQALLEYVLENERNFETSAVVETDEDKKKRRNHRRSKVLFQIKTSKWLNVFQSRLKLYLPHIQSILNIAPFRLGNFEIQLTASNDGDYFKAHADHSPEAERLATRQITYVYYLSREPVPFTGGGLLLYRHWPDPSSYQNVKSVTTVTPRNNCLVAFASNRWHELDLVRCPSGKFADSRFTVNGWLHPAKPAA